MNDQNFSPDELSREIEKLIFEQQTLQTKLDDLNTANTKLTKALLESEERFLKFFNLSPLATTISRISDGCILDANIEYLRLTERTLDELVGNASSAPKNWKHPEQRELIFARLEKEGVLKNIDVELLTKSGQIRYMLMSAAKVVFNGEDCAVLSAQDITERKRTEENLVLNEERLKLALLASEQGLWDWNIPEDSTFLSPKYYELCGYSPGEIIPDYDFFKKLVHPEDWMHVEKTMSDHIQGKSEHSLIEYRMITKDGNVKWIRGIGKVVKRASMGNPERMMGIISDITERKKAEMSLRLSEERIKVALKTADIAVFNQDLEQRYTWIYQPQLGHSIENIIGKTDADLLPAEAAEKVFKLKQRVLTLGEKIQAEIPVCANDKTHIYYLVAEPMVDANGGVIGLTGASHDITKGKVDEASLIKSEHKWRKLFDMLPIGASIFDKQNSLVEINQALEKIFGYSNKQILNKQYLEHTFLDSENRPLQIQNFPSYRAISENKNIGPEKICMQKQDGSFVWLEVCAAPLPYDDAACVVVTSNITDRITAEEEQRKSREVLVESESQMRNLYKQLYNVREDERAFISREIHDELGQIFTAFKMDLNWVKEKTKNDTALTNKINAMIELVNTTTKKVQQISADLRPEMLYDLGLTSAIEWYSQEFSERSGISCRHVLEDVHISDPGISLMLFRIVQEGCTNIVRHAQAKNATLTLSSSSNEIILTLEDDGIGISELQQLSSASLGLRGIKERLRQFNGSLEIESTPPHGTRIKVRVPL